jgi:nucleoside-diphosphate-sugar epimerase
MDEGGTVLVTGGSGFIGAWCIIGLLRRGHVVRTTVRDLKRADDVRAMIATEIDPGNRLSFFAAELTDDRGWAEAVQGCDYVLHVASPLPPAQPRNADELIVPARDGALRVLRASVAAGVKRVVMTSSVAAVTLTRAEPRPDPLTEEHWTDPAHPEATPYAQSKTLAERAAWDFIREKGGTTRLATVNPVVVIGPVLGRDYSVSVQVIERLLKGNIPGIPRLGFPLVDVRDVADLHIAAMTAPEAAGERFIATGPFLWMSEIADVLKARLGSEAARVPTRRAPSWLVRFMAMFDSTLRLVTPELGRRRNYSSDKARRMLGWTPRPIEDSIVDCARSLISHGALQS